MIKCPPEKLGSFFLGAEYDVNAQQLTEEVINYDARDLTTHAVCVGMTGSGKTGLCIGLLEEAALDKVPALIIDPKGDMTNLMLQFEDLEAASFEPWINADDAARKDLSVDAYAQKTANLWKDGLQSWGQDLSRIKALKEATEVTIYTPGSNSGVPINIMGSFAAPGISFDDDAEMLRERIQGTVAALLGMIDSKEDPVKSREGILLSNIFEHFWREGQDLDLASLIKSIQSPPMSTLGVFDIETFFPSKDRFQLAMAFNSLIASPQFKFWLQGEDLDIDKLYYTPEGKPKQSIFYIAHLSESERMFFVTLLLNSLITWMRAQSGTTSLRSLMYFDEIFGYFPPIANPPSKKPLLTLLKQARAYGVGCVLVTQNPVDIDYKGLSNAGTWFIGKLQTERDKMRVLEGLEGAIAEAGGKSLDFNKIITGLDSRVFLLHNVHEDQPVVFHTRWVMSYLRGPMTRPQIKNLMSAKKERAASGFSSSIVEVEKVRAEDVEMKTQELPPSLGHNIAQRFLAVWNTPYELGLPSNSSLSYKPCLMGVAKVRFYDEKRNVDIIQDFALLGDTADDFGRINWDAGIKLTHWQKALLTKPDHPEQVSLKYESVPESMNTAKEIGEMEKEFSNWLYQNQRYFTLEHAEFKLYQKADETDEAFRMRVQVTAKEKRDEAVDKLHDKYDAKFNKLEDKIRRELRDLDEAEAEVRSRRNDELFNVVETVFGGVFGRRRRSLGSVSTKRRMARKAKEKLREVEEDIEILDEAKMQLEDELKQQTEEITKLWESSISDISHKEIKPRRTDVKVSDFVLVWHPFWKSESGALKSAVQG